MAVNALNEEQKHLEIQHKEKIKKAKKQYYAYYHKKPLLMSNPRSNSSSNSIKRESPSRHIERVQTLKEQREKM